MSHRQTSAAQQHTCGYIPGEIKVAVAIRLLAGGSYLDLMPLFCMVKSSIHKAFDQVIHWVLCTFEFLLPALPCCTNLLKILKKRVVGIFMGVLEPSMGLQ